MELIFQIPGKTFLLGEYAVLNSAPALVFCHEPYFEFEVRDQLSPGFSKWDVFFHPESPAGIYSRQLDLHKYNLFIKCDHQYGHGGFGLSTAEFLVAYQIGQMVRGKSRGEEFIVDDLQLETDHQQLLLAYWSIFDSSTKKRPSGADLQAQSRGGFCYVDQKQGILQNFPWLFDDLSVIVVPTGNKLKTHEHLNQLENLNFSSLIAMTSQLNHVFAKADSAQLITLVNEYGVALAQMGLLTPYSSQLMEDLRSIHGVHAIKGCGAMGADSILMIVSSQQKKIIQDELRRRDLRFFDSVGKGSVVL